MSQAEENVKSPCRDDCTLDSEKICQGCFRSLEEIVQWPNMNDQMRREVLHNALERQEKKHSK